MSPNLYNKNSVCMYVFFMYLYSPFFIQHYVVVFVNELDSERGASIFFAYTGKAQWYLRCLSGYSMSNCHPPYAVAGHPLFVFRQLGPLWSGPWACLAELAWANVGGGVYIAQTKIRTEHRNIHQGENKNWPSERPLFWIGLLVRSNCHALNLRPTAYVTPFLTWRDVSWSVSAGWSSISFPNRQHFYRQKIGCSKLR